MPVLLCFVGVTAAAPTKHARTGACVQNTEGQLKSMMPHGITGLESVNKFKCVLKNSMQSGALFQEPSYSHVLDFSVILHDTVKHQMNISLFTSTRLLTATSLT
jgi:hypothetical protein